MKAIVIVPSNRPDRMQQFINAWEPMWGQKGSDTVLLIIEDAPKPSKLSFPPPNTCRLTHKDIDAIEGEKADCIDRFSPGIRSYGILVAARQKPDVIVSLDDDCLPISDDNPLGLSVDAVRGHCEVLAGDYMTRWVPLQDNPFLRGVPYASGIVTKQGVLNHGMVMGVPDIDAVTALTNPGATTQGTNETWLIPFGMYFPMSIQNVAFRPEIAPLMYLPKLPDGMKRWSDIWCGIVMKRICDAHGLVVTAGKPCVQHDRASNVWANLRQEWAGYEVNEEFWKVVDSASVKGDGLLEDYRSIALHIGTQLPILKETSENMLKWSELWEWSIGIFL